MTSPCESLRAVSTESAMRDRTSGLTMMRSTTASMLCVKVFLSAGNAGGECSSTISPSTRARTNPCLCSAPKVSLCSPFCPRMSGERIMSLAPAGKRMIESTICDADWLAITRPHFQQCGVPARAKSTRR